jgi:hydrogenase expression/formation protein HypC
MCLGIPYQVIELLEDESVLVQVGSGSQRCFSGLIEQVNIGDWLLVHAGFAVEKITEEDAHENLALINRYIFGDEVLETQARRLHKQAASLEEH